MLLHRDTEQSLLSVERIRERAREIQAGGIGVVSIASNGASAINLLPWVIAEFQQDQPEVRIDLKVRGSRKIASWVAGRQVDIGLIDAPVPIPGLNAEIIRTPCLCILQKTDPPCRESRITPESLTRRSAISIAGDHSIDRQLDRLVRRASRVEITIFHRLQPGAGRSRRGNRQCDKRPSQPWRRRHLETA